jgi:hypothetical protein
MLRPDAAVCLFPVAVRPEAASLREGRHGRNRGQGSAPPRYRRTPRAPRRTRLRPVNRRAPGRFRRPPATTAPHRSASCRSDEQGELEHRVQDVGEHQTEQPESGSASSPRSGRWRRSRPPPASSSPCACTRHGLPARPIGISVREPTRPAHSDGRGCSTGRPAARLCPVLASRATASSTFTAAPAVAMSGHRASRIPCGVPV